MNVRAASFASEDGNAQNRYANTSPLRGGAAAAAGKESERELFALLALAILVYATMEFLFAGDLTLLPVPTPPSSSSGRTPNQPSRAFTSSRYAEELHTLLTAQSRWLTLSGLHVLASSSFVFWVYIFHSHTDSSAATTSVKSGLGLLANRVVFTTGLADILFWSYLWTVLKEEGRDVARSLARRKESEEDEDN